MNGRIRNLGIPGLCIVALSLWAATLPAYGSSLTVSHTFQTVDQNMWGPGPPFTFNFSNFYGLTWNKSGGVDALGCGWLGCYGAEFNAYTSGKIGVDVGLNVSSGLVSASVPASIDLGFPDAVDPGLHPTFVVNSFAGLGTGLLTTSSPTASAYADLVFKILAGATGELCFVGCGSFGGNIVNINTGTELIGLNRNNDGQLRILGQNYGLPASGNLGGYIDYTVSLPIVNTSGTGSLVLVSAGQSDFVDVSANLVNIATSVLGLPPLSGSVGPIDYNLLSAGLGLDVGVVQVFSLMPLVHVSLDVAETGQTVSFASPTFLNVNSPAINIPHNVKALHVTPTYSMDGVLVNSTSLALDPYLYANGGSFGMSGIGTVGPLFDVKYDIGSIPIQVYNSSFTLDGFASFTGPTVEIDVVPEPGSLLLLGSGVAGIAVALIRRRRCR